MIKYICNNKNKQTGEPFPCTGQTCMGSTCPTCGGRTDAYSRIYWCEECRIPLYEEHCSHPEHHVQYLSTDIRPVFPEEWSAIVGIIRC